MASFKARLYHGELNIPIGRVYVIQFGNGVIKVGHTIDYEERLKYYHRRAAPFDISIEREWCSREHWQHQKNEGLILHSCREVSNVKVTASEFFKGLDFDWVVATAARIVENSE
ncbi:GIY-YIG nuclease family protein [Amycolatopsis roodepoortensis]|uniref:Bacteriophage T5 Orf172 DNA-binding domain-containing protein n=1 Tax=Amycolatopsis roodepoortensis TaxID=700274 RepID=A0ABR9LB80_9PSEU|nr:GIY-YIG nuclease family protein [Amycolatopsis roodepoortensis]MBE1577682.1 hypothetical protein [Amycolatopsis roodepoortensis]